MLTTFDIISTTETKDMKGILKEELKKEKKGRYPASLPVSIKERLFKTSLRKSSEMNADISMNELIVFYLDSSLPSLEELERSVA